MRTLFGHLNCARTRCKTCPFICNVKKLSRPKRSIKITDHFTCTSTNVIYCITCTLCKKFYIGETGRRLGDRLRNTLKLLGVEKDDRNVSKPVTGHFNPQIIHSNIYMTVFGLSLPQGNTESRKLQNKNLFFKSALYQRTLLIQPIYSVVFPVTRHQPIA